MSEAVPVHDPRRAALRLADELRDDPAHREWARDTVQAYREGRITERPITLDEIDRLTGS